MCGWGGSCFEFAFFEAVRRGDKIEFGGGNVYPVISLKNLLDIFNFEFR